MKHYANICGMILLDSFQWFPGYQPTPLTGLRTGYHSTAFKNTHLLHIWKYEEGFFFQFCRKQEKNQYQLVLLLQ
jgi:hypothetical protein